MNTVVKMFLNLVIVGAFSGAVLAAVFTVADPMIQANKAQELKEAIFKVLPEARDYKAVEKKIGPDEKFTVYLGIDDDRNPVGVAFKADGGGFQGNIGVMVGLNLDYLNIQGIEILDQLETPGLGDRIREPSFKDQFKGLEVQPKVEYIKYRKPEKPNQIQAITGATISSDAVVKNINNAVAKLLKSFPAEEMKKIDTKAPDAPAPKVKNGK